jgi:hypothetical protein
MANTIKIKRGLKTNLPTLEVGEQGYCTDTNELFIGTSTGNILVSELVNQASISDATDTGEVSNTHLRQVNASNSSTASGLRSQVNASLSSTASGSRSQINASQSSNTTGDRSQVNASFISTTSGTRSQVNASDNSESSGQNTQVNASTSSTASATNSQVNASTSSTASGLRSQVNGSSSSTASGAMSMINGCDDSIATERRAQVNGSEFCEATGRMSQVNGSDRSNATAINSSVISSRRVINTIGRSIAGGDAGTGDASTANRKWHIFGANGNISIAGTLTSSASFSDFAEFFPNGTKKEQGYGLLQTLDGDAVKPAQEGERVIGVTSATAGVLLNDTPFAWQGRYLKDEWGKPIYEDIPDPDYELKEGETEADRPIISIQKENRLWDASKEQVSRKKRPDEWSVVGLTGQVFVRLNEGVKVGDNVKAWKDGVGQASEEDTNIVVMKITQDYDKNKGYAIGYCLIK